MLGVYSHPRWFIVLRGVFSKHIRGGVRSIVYIGLLTICIFRVRERRYTPRGVVGGVQYGREVMHGVTYLLLAASPPKQAKTRRPDSNRANKKYFWQKSHGCPESNVVCLTTLTLPRQTGIS